jgi:hypothetical protein
MGSFQERLILAFEIAMKCLSDISARAMLEATFGRRSSNPPANGNSIDLISLGDEISSSIKTYIGFSENLVRPVLLIQLSFQRITSPTHIFSP